MRSSLLRKPGASQVGAALLLLLSVATCGRSTPSESRESSAEPALRVQDASATDSPIATFERRDVARGLEVLEASADGRVLAGLRRPVPEQSSARLVFSAQLFDEQGRLVPAALPEGVQDARFAPPPSRSLAVLDTHDELWLYEPPYDEPRRIDTQVFPGFAFSSTGRSLALARGRAPELYGFRVDLATGARVQLTHHGNPVWGFAFSPDARRIAWVDSREGYPSLMTTDENGGAPVKLTNRGVPRDAALAGRLAPFPDGRRPPLWTTTGLWVEDSNGVHAIGGQGELLLGVAGASELHRGRAPDTVLFRESGRMRRVP